MNIACCQQSLTLQTSEVHSESFLFQKLHCHLKCVFCCSCEPVVLHRDHKNQFSVTFFVLYFLTQKDLLTFISFRQSF